MLEELLSTHREALIERCRAAAALRHRPTSALAELDEHGVPVFLLQLSETLRLERELASTTGTSRERPPWIGSVAALRGAELLRQGYTIEQVVREYGDVCQSVTSLAVELGTEVSADEFRTMNLCLDDAIADAVKAFSDGEATRDGEATMDLSKVASKEDLRLIDIAIGAFTAIATGRVGASGATGGLLRHTLEEMRRRVEASLTGTETLQLNVQPNRIDSVV